MKRGSPLKRTPMKRSRPKARPGRLKGADMTALRSESYQHHKGICIFCGLFVPERDFELAHRRGKRNHGDSLDNVGPAHRTCHRDSHNAGGKPVPKGEWRSTME